MCATSAGADDFLPIANWARQHTDSPGQSPDLSAGIPSHGRLIRIFRPTDAEIGLDGALDILD